MNNIPAGYQLHIISWENDADNYRTKVISGLEYADVNFYLHFLRHFHFSYSKEKIGVGFGNTNKSTYPDAEKIAIESAWECYPPSSQKLIEDVKSSIEHWNNYPNQSCDWVYETIGTWYGSDIYRVFDDFSVYYVPTEILDITREFELYSEDS